MATYFVHCPSCGFEEFETVEKRDEAAKECIEHHLDESWDEEVENVVSGEVQERAEKVNVVKRPDDLDEDDCDESGKVWLPEWSYKCDYKMLPIAQN